MLVVRVSHGRCRGWEGNSVSVVDVEYNSLYEYIVSECREDNDLTDDEVVDLTDYGFSTNDSDGEGFDWEDDDEGNCESYSTIDRLEDLLDK
jgi:hypothetical protein